MDLPYLVLIKALVSFSLSHFVLQQLYGTSVGGGERGPTCCRVRVGVVVKASV